MPELRLPSAREVENLAILEHFCLSPERCARYPARNDDWVSTVDTKHVHWIKRMMAMQLHRQSILAARPADAPHFLAHVHSAAPASLKIAPAAAR